MPSLKEHVVPRADLVALAGEAGLETVLVQNAAEFVSVEDPMVGLYNVFVFCKKN